MITVSTRRRTTALTIPLVLGAALTGCADKHPDYQTDYSNHRPLRVTGHPSTGSLEAVQRVVWRLADGDVDGLAALDTEGGDARPAARAWIKAYGRAAARDEVTADFHEEGSVRQVVALHFTGPDRTQQLMVRIGEHDTWGIVLVNPEPTDVKKSGPAPTTR
ncbi:hypothetical protein GTY81_05120 [Streptomyces sp. SID8366]|uniref:hypothetical protein n=1 Tax=unclassified Streptomyces TaxID=2593676 RepID=UPI000DBAA34F|nr:hypothetical protein [Streptomyces sp. PsTaAH-130]MYU03287.1 hypothetical protein [Streptomyces sp. SID8366]MYU64683.1 hypothetical protein [Streptomyces sp. SID69]RAJ57197.1 hypothetical protein K376_04088 [Streptomyces sp. PsTaAH-130]